MDDQTISKVGYHTWQISKYPALITLVLVTVGLGVAALGEGNPRLWDQIGGKEEWVSNFVKPVTFVGVPIVAAAAFGYVTWRLGDYLWAERYYEGEKPH